MNAIDLFCGCGGLSYGFEKAGVNILLGIDNDQKALDTFILNHKGSKCLCGDITQINYESDIKKLIGDKQIDIIVLNCNIKCIKKFKNLYRQRITQ